MRPALPSTGVADLAAGAKRGRVAKLQRQHGAAEELRRLTELMTKRAAERRCAAHKPRDQLFTGPIAHLAHPMTCAGQDEPNGMFNNHGLGSLELSNTSDDMPSGLEDRFDSDSMKHSDDGCAPASWPVISNTITARQLFQNQSQRQRPSRLIIPKRLYFDGQTSSSYQPGSRSSTQQQPPLLTTLGSNASRSCSSHSDCSNSISESLLSEPVSFADSQEMIFEPTKTDVPHQRMTEPQSTANCQCAKQSADQPTESWETEPSQDLEPSQTDSSQEDNTGAHQDMVGLPLCAIELSGVQQEQKQQLLHMQLCTSSSNCCGGRRKKGSETSAESIELVNGACILSRPGSLSGINIEGLATRKMPCTHDDPDIRDEMRLNRALSINRRDSVAAPRDGRRRVSFSKCIHRDENSEIQTSTLQSTETEILHLRKLSAPNSDTLEHIDFDSKEQSVSKPSVQKEAKLDNQSSAAIIEATVEVPSRQPPPVPPHATKRLTELLHQSDVNRAATATECNSTMRMETGRLFSLSNSQQLTSDCMSSVENDSNLNLAIGHVFASSEVNLKYPKVDTALTAMENQDTFSIFSDQDMSSDLEPGQRTIGISKVSTASTMPHKSLRRSNTRLDSRLDSRQDCRLSDTNSSSERRVHLGGSNCANSSVNRDFHHHFNRHHPRVGSSAARTQHPSTSLSAGCSSTTTAPSTSPTIRRCAALAESSSYLVFQHPPQVSRSSKNHSRVLGSIHSDSRRSQSEADETSEESIAFSWITRVDTGVARGLEVSLDNSQTSSSHNCSGGYSASRNGATSKVTFNQINTAEGQTVSIKAVVADSARVGAINGQACVKPADVRDSGAVSSLAKCVLRPPSSSSEQASGNGSTDSDSSQPFLMLEAISCGHKDQESHGYSIACRSYASASTQAAATLAKGSSSVVAEKQQQAPSRATVGLPKAPPAQAQTRRSSNKPLPPPPQPQQPPPPQPRQPPQAKPRSQAHAPQPSPEDPPPPTPPLPSAAAAAATAEVVRDLLTRVCDPAEAAALTRALVRGLVCNVESLRSALVAALMLLKDRKSCTGPLAQAIGTANTLDELVRQVQASHSRGGQRRRRRQQQHRTGGDMDWWQVPPALDSHSTTLESGGDDGSTDDEDVDLSFRRCGNNKQRPFGIKSWDSDAITRRSERSESAPVGTLPCHAMAHYVVGEQFVEPSLEQHPSLGCRPVTTRLVRPEFRAVNLSGDSKLKRPTARARRSEVRY